MKKVKLDVVQRMYDDRFNVYAYLYTHDYECENIGRWVLVAVNRVRELAIRQAKNSLNFREFEII